jgi:nucleolar protein 9
VQDKITRSLLPFEHNLAGSQYGKYFARNLNLVLFKRDPVAWKRMQAAKSSSSSQESKVVPQSVLAPAAAPAQPEAPQKANKRKRKAKADDDIDELFDSAFGGKKVRRAMGTKHEHPDRVDVKEEKAKVEGLQDVLGAIRRAPKEDKGRRKKT